MAKTPSTPRPKGQGSAARVYEAPVRTSGTPRETKTAGHARMVNHSEVHPGQGTSGDGNKFRRPKG